MRCRNISGSSSTRNVRISIEPSVASAGTCNSTVTSILSSVLRKASIGVTLVTYPLLSEAENLNEAGLAIFVTANE